MLGSEPLQEARDPSRPLRVAIVGVGLIGAVHARAARLAGAQIGGVGAGTLAEAEAAAAQLGAARTYTDPAEVAADPDVDVVHVCTPNALHEPYTAAALAAGKHVVCEKPLGLDLAGARRMGEQARAAGVVATVPFTYRFHPMVRELRHRIRDAQLGKPRLVHGSYLQDWLADEEARNWRTDVAVGGASRAFADIGSHWCDLMEFVVGERIARVRATLVTGSRATTEDAALVQFETDAGTAGSVLVSQVSRGHANHLVLEVDGSLASGRFDQERPDVLQWADAAGSQVLLRGAATMSAAAAALNLLPPGHPQGFNDAFGLFVAHTYNAIRGEAHEGLPTFEDGVRAAVLVDAVLASARSGGWASAPAEDVQSVS